MTAENKAGKLAYYSNPQEPVKATSHGGKEKEEALLLRGPHNKERWNTRSSVASRLIVTTCLSFQASKTSRKTIYRCSMPGSAARSSSLLFARGTIGRREIHW